MSITTCGATVRVITVAVGFAVLVGGCSSGGGTKVATAELPGAAQPTGTSGSRTTTSNKPLTIAQERQQYIADQRQWVTCLRAHGANPNDPDSKGQVAFPGDPASLKRDPAFRQAMVKCARYSHTPPTELVEADRPTLSKSALAVLQRYSRCMQTNGAPAYPDPGPKGMPDSTWPGFDPNAPANVRAGNLCYQQVYGIDPTQKPAG